MSAEKPENNKQNQQSKHPNILVKPIKELIVDGGYSFVIPGYQRGYRWGNEQVNELLDDIDEFMNSTKDRQLEYSRSDDNLSENSPTKDERIYLLQPLVVAKEKDKSSYAVIDGQQRLTTVKILLSYLRETESYDVEYETRGDSKAFLNGINDPEKAVDNKEKSKDNADFYHIYHAQKAIDAWFDDKKKDCDYKADFLKTLKERVCFVWYETTDPNPIDVFTRLNKGKISLTESELIKALFLSSNNFTETATSENKLLTLLEIANEWDRIEYRLQDDRFWLFFHETGYSKPTRIDFILDIVRELAEKDKTHKDNNARHRIFNYFYNEFKNATDKQEHVTVQWKEINRIYMMLEEWYNDEQLYHYIGFLCAVRKAIKVRDYIKEYLGENNKNKTKKEFLTYLEKKIKEKETCPDECRRDIDYKYEVGQKKKKEAKPILLLHNIQSVLDQNKSIEGEKKYGLPDFVRFPFHLYKKENWDIEHIRPNVALDYEHDSEGKKGKERAKYVYLLRQAQGKKLKEAVEEYDKSIESVGEEEAFEALWKTINDDDNGELPEDEKNLIWNYALLDFGTNREYGNSCFEIKRRFLLKKEKGIKPKLKVDDNYKVVLSEEKEAAFVPICTKNIFSKAYTDFPDNLLHWTVKDAAYYRFDIEKTLWWYLFDGEEHTSLEKLDDDGRKEVFDKYREDVLEKGDYHKSFKKWYEADKVNSGNGGN